MFPNITGRALVQERHVEERSNVYKKLEGVKTMMQDSIDGDWGRQSLLAMRMREMLVRFQDQNGLNPPRADNLFTHDMKPKIKTLLTLTQKF